MVGVLSEAEVDTPHGLGFGAETVDRDDPFFVLHTFMKLVNKLCQFFIPVEQQENIRAIFFFKCNRGPGSLSGAASAVSHLREQGEDGEDLVVPGVVPRLLLRVLSRVVVVLVGGGAVPGRRLQGAPQQVQQTPSSLPPRLCRRARPLVPRRPPVTPTLSCRPVPPVRPA